MFRVNACIKDEAKRLFNPKISTMIIGSEFSKKYHRFLKEIAIHSNESTSKRISVKDINSNLNLDRTEIKNVLEYLQELGYISLETIGGPLLYGHITITDKGLEKYYELTS